MTVSNDALCTRHDRHRPPAGRVYEISDRRECRRPLSRLPHRPRSRRRAGSPALSRPGLPDDEVLAIANSEGRVLITDDRDFGELVFRYRQPHAGVIYFRLQDTLIATRLARLAAVLDRYPQELSDFVVVTNQRMRARRPTST